MGQTIEYTPFSKVYSSFLSKITDDMYLELTQQDTYKILRDLLISALSKFEFPRINLDFQLFKKEEDEQHQQESTEDGEWEDFINSTSIEDSEYSWNDFSQNNEESQDENNTNEYEQGFINILTDEQINIISTYMIVQWIGQQLASIEVTRMKYSGSDFKFTSQANHMAKLLAMKKEYEREGFHLQRLYSRRKKDNDGIYHSTFGTIMQKRPQGRLI